MLAEPEWQLTTRNHGPCLVVTIRGEIDGYNALLLRSQLLEAMAEGRTCLILDLSAVDLVDSSALRVLIRLRRRAVALHGYLDVVVNRPFLTQLFRVTALDKVFALYDSLDAALAAHEESVGAAG
jgi:anti-sigma B factor antagonist